VYSLCSRELNQSLGALQTVTWSILLGTVMLTATTLISGRISLNALAAVHWPQLFSLLYLGVLGSALAYIAGTTHPPNRRDPRRCVYRAESADAVICGAALLDERLTLPMLLGGAVILLGIYLCNKPLAPSRPMGI